MDNVGQRATRGPIWQHHGAPASKGCHIHQSDDPECASSEVAAARAWELCGPPDTTFRCVPETKKKEIS
jgi:hypothetical protein